MQLRAAAHVHSAWSYDGSWSLPDLADAFRRRGYRVVLMAEHDRTFTERRWRDYKEACAEASSPDLLLVPGLEYSDRGNRVHVPVWADLPFLGAGRRPADVIAAAHAAGGVSVLAHPRRRAAAEALDDAALAMLSGIELWNRKYDGWAASTCALELLARLPDARPFVGLDFHTSRQFFPLAMLVDPDELTCPAVIRALTAGRFTAQAFGRPASSLCDGSALAATRGAEGIRRQLAHLRRRARTRRSVRTRA